LGVPRALRCGGRPMRALTLLRLRQSCIVPRGALLCIRTGASLCGYSICAVK